VGTKFKPEQFCIKKGRGRDQSELEGKKGKMRRKSNGGLAKGPENLSQKRKRNSTARKTRNTATLEKLQGKKRREKVRKGGGGVCEKLDRRPTREGKAS